MPHENEIDAKTLAEWLENFNDESPNIFEVFQENEIILTKDIYETLCTDEDYYLRFYMGLTENDTPKIIAVAAAPDNGVYTDVLEEGQIYEVYTQSSISLETAQGFIDNWKDNSGDDLFKYAFLIPRTNLVKLFETDGLDEIKIYFGLDDEIKAIQQKPSLGSGDPALDRNAPCPPFCGNDSSLINS